MKEQESNFVLKVQVCSLATIRLLVEGEVVFSRPEADAIQLRHRLNRLSQQREFSLSCTRTYVRLLFWHASELLVLYLDRNCSR